LYGRQGLCVINIFVSGDGHVFVLSRILRNSDGFYFRTLISLSKGILNTIDLVLDDTPIENNNKEESRVGVLHEDDALANLNCFQRF
jgi:hypothetical protein